MTLDELIAKQEITEVILRISRGQDRLEPEITRASYHEDALHDSGFDRHLRDEYVERSQKDLRQLERAMHFCGPPLIELEGDVAYAETYALACHETGPDHPGGIAWQSGNILVGLRYVDRLERRNGTWRMAHRTLVFEWVNKLPVQSFAEFWPQPAHPLPMGRRDKSDRLHTIRQTTAEQGGHLSPTTDTAR